jgi:hypothetical protein
VEHRRSTYLNNRAGNSHQPTRQRERAMKKFTSPDRAQRHCCVGGSPRAGRLGLMRRRPARVSTPWSGFASFRFPPEVIMVAVRSYLRYGVLSRRGRATALTRLCSARVISAGHAFVQNLRRGHYALGWDIDRRYRLTAIFVDSPAPSDRGSAAYQQTRYAVQWSARYGLGIHQSTPVQSPELSS